MPPVETHPRYREWSDAHDALVDAWTNLKDARAGSGASQIQQAQLAVLEAAEAYAEISEKID